MDSTSESSGPPSRASKDAKPKKDATPKAERLVEILTRVARHGEVHVDELARILGVSSVQIRNDIRSLSDLGTVNLEVRRGRVAIPATMGWVENTDLGVRMRRSDRRKVLLGRVGAALLQRLLRPSAWLFLGAGSQTLELSRAVQERFGREWRSLRFQTNNLQLALEYLSMDHPWVELHGGHVSRDLGALLRSDLIESGLSQNRPDCVCFSVHNVSLGASELGAGLDVFLHANNDSEIQIERAIIDVAERHVMMMFDSQKLLHRAGGTVRSLRSLLEVERQRASPHERRRLVFLTDSLPESNRERDRLLEAECQVAELLGALEGASDVVSWVVLGREADGPSDCDRLGLGEGHELRGFPKGGGLLDDDLGLSFSDLSVGLPGRRI